MPAAHTLLGAGSEADDRSIGGGGLVHGRTS
jgi:hypothetical protein